jgi:hypothetical protein
MIDRMMRRRGEAGTDHIENMRLIDRQQGQTASKNTKPNQTRPNQTKPDQTNSNEMKPNDIINR